MPCIRVLPTMGYFYVILQFDRPLEVLSVVVVDRLGDQVWLEPLVSLALTQQTIIKYSPRVPVRVPIQIACSLRTGLGVIA